MTRKLLSLLLALMILLQLPAAASANDSADIQAAVRAAYWSSGKVYAFADFPQAEAPETLDVSLMFNNQVIGTTKPALLKNTNTTAHYLLLVDNSMSMGQHRSWVFSFVQEVMKAQTDSIRVSVAFFDREFQLVDTGMDSWSEVRSALWKTTNNKEETDIGGAVAWALEYLGDETGKTGDVNNLVVITDGEPWYSGSQKKNADAKEQAVQNASAMMAAYPEVAVHTLCLGTWEENIHSVLSAGKGLHLEAGSSAAAKKAGAELSEYMDGLCTMAFTLNGYDGVEYITDDLKLCVGTHWSSVGHLRNIDQEPAAAPIVVPVVPVIPAPEGEAEPTDPTEESTEPAEGETEPTEGETEPTEEGIVPTEALPDGQGSEDPTQDTVPDETVEETGIDETEETVLPDAAEEKGGPGWLIPAIAAAAVILVLAVLLLLKKCRAPKDSVRMRVEVLSGRVAKLKKDYYLTDQLLIGTDKRCHIVIDDPGAAPSNTRIFKRGQMIYIEDMDSPGGTVLGGMRIYSSNRLRSGDDITIGTVTLRILF